MKISRRHLLSCAGVLLCAGLLVWHYCFRSNQPFPAAIPPVYSGETHVEVEQKLRPLAIVKRTPADGDWLHTYRERGQSFEAYVSSEPVRRDSQKHTIFFCLVGSFSPAQERILETTRQYVSLCFNCPVKIHKRQTLEGIPAQAQRKHPSEGQLQLLTKYFLNDSLKVDRPDDALAYVAFTSADLWTKDPDGRDWNYVFGMADLRNRLGVWSMARFGKPDNSDREYAQCLKLTLGTATHETGHILGMLHCVYYECNMNGSNHLVEARNTPLALCPICLRKLCWNLRIEPRAYLQSLLEFSLKHQMHGEVSWYKAAIEALGR